MPGTISYLSWGLDTAFGSGLTLALNRNSTSTPLAISIGGSVTGWVTDSTDSVSVSNGDALDFAVDVSSVTTSYSGSFFCTSARFGDTTSSTQSAQMIAAVGLTEVTPTIIQGFVCLLGFADYLDHTEGDQQVQSMAAGTWQNIACHIQSNGFDKPAIIVNRKNGTNGSMSISVPAFTSGYFEDASDSDSVNAGDLLDYGIANGSSVAGSGSFFMDWIGAHFLATNATLCMIGGSGGLGGGLGIGTFYTSLFGGGEPDDTISRTTGLFSYDLDASQFTNHLVELSPGAATFTLLRNGSAALSISTLPGQTGYITDNGSTDYSVGDTCANQIVVTQDSVKWVSATLLLQAR